MVSSGGGEGGEWSAIRIQESCWLVCVWVALGGCGVPIYIYTRDWGWGGGGRPGRTPGGERGNAARRPARPRTRHPTPAKGRLGGCARTYVSAAGGIEFDRGASAGRREPGVCCVRRQWHRARSRSRLLGIYAMLAALGCLKNSAIPLGGRGMAFWHVRSVGTNGFHSIQVSSVACACVRACVRAHPLRTGHYDWPAGRPPRPAATAQWSMQSNSTAARVVRGRTAPTTYTAVTVE